MSAALVVAATTATARMGAAKLSGTRHADGAAAAVHCKTGHTLDASTTGVRTFSIAAADPGCLISADTGAESVIRFSGLEDAVRLEWLSCPPECTPKDADVVSGTITVGKGQGVLSGCTKRPRTSETGAGAAGGARGGPRDSG